MLMPLGISPALKSFLYKTYCLSKFTYALETTILNKLTINQLNINQNNLIRQLLGINKFSHMSNILQCMRIHNFEDLYLRSKLSFLDTIKNNEIALAIFNTLCSDLEKSHSRTNSFQKDIILLQSHFGLDIAIIFARPLALKQGINDAFKNRDGLSDSVDFCISNIKNKFYKKTLNDLIRPQFLKDYIDQMHNIIDE